MTSAGEEKTFMMRLSNQGVSSGGPVPRAVLDFSRCRDGFLSVLRTAAGDAFAGVQRAELSEFSGLGMRQKLEQ